jgi:hypothetical protein
LVRAAHQQITRGWWARRDGFDLYSSRLVVQECQAGDAGAAADRLAALAGIPLLEQEAEAAELADALLRDVPLPQKAAADALHIATAAVHGMQYLLTWNCTTSPTRHCARGSKRCAGRPASSRRSSARLRSYRRRA